MREPRLTRWKQLDKCEGLLIFAQRIEESLFDYTLDSFKAPALNTHTRALELRNAISDVTNGGFPEAALASIVEELSASIKADSAAGPLLEPYCSHFETADAWKARPPSDLRIEVDLILHRLKGRYRLQLEHQIREAVVVGKEKAKLMNLTASWITELLNEGFSRDFVFHQTRTFFFGFGGPSISEPECIDDFFAGFRAKAQRWTVVFQADKEFQTLFNGDDESVVRTSDSWPVVKQANSRVRAFLKPIVDRVYLSVDVDALDARSAKRKADAIVHALSTLIRLHVHKKPFDWSGECVVFHGEECLHLKQSPSAVLKHSECAFDELPTRFNRTLMLQSDPNFSRESKRRLASALNLHSAALSSSSVENQLASLWAAIEAILPMATADAKISRIAEFMVPLLSRSYPAKLLTYLDSKLRELVPEAYDTTCAVLPAELSRVEKCAAIVSIDSNEPLRDELYMAAAANPLLRYRIWTLKCMLNDAASIKSAIDEHARRVNWHLRRVYRSRNLLVHSGRMLPYRDAIVESLHSYVHRLIDLVEEALMQKPKPGSLDAALVAIRMDHEAHVRALSYAKRERCELENFQTFVFGPMWQR